MQIQDEGLYQPLFGSTISLLKAANDDPNGGLPRWGGIASSESTDQDGDVMLAKTLDVSYISQRGYVNWDHSRAPIDQLGAVTKTFIVKAADIPKYEDMLRVTLNKSSSLYTEGYLYAHNPRAMEVHNLLKSVPDGQDGGLGLSVEGGVIRNEGKIAKALVRGVAITPVPAQPDTLCRLMKSLCSGASNGVVHESPEALVNTGLTFNEAVLWLMQKKPKITYELAKATIQHIFNKRSAGDAK